MQRKTEVDGARQGGEGEAERCIEWGKLVWRGAFVVFSTHEIRRHDGLVHKRQLDQ